MIIASDSPSIQAEVTSVLPAPDYEVKVVHAGSQVLPAVRERTPDLVILDFQIGNMGGMATCLDLRLEASADRIPTVPVMLLLDRRADVFLARRSGSNGWIIKPLDPIRLRKAVRATLDGGRYEDASFQPTATVAVS